MFVDNLFFQFVSELKNFPSLLISFFNFIVCLIAIYIVRKRFGYAGLCSYMVLSSVIANIQVLYATSYEILNIEVLLGTVIFCSSFLACDLINIEYGPEKAKRAVYLTIFTDLFFLLNIILTLGHKPIDYTQFTNFSISEKTMNSNISAIHQIFLPIPRLLIASYLAYLFSQLGEIWLLNFTDKLTWFKSKFIKHNLSLFVSNVCLDTIVFTSIGMWILSSEPLNLNDFWQICFSAIIVRVICNLGNTFFIKILKNNKF